MIKKFFSMAMIATAILATSCEDDDDASEMTMKEGMSTLKSSVKGLAPLGDDYLYEGWVLVDGTPVSTGRFSLNSDGSIPAEGLTTKTEYISKATAFVLTIEPKKGDDPAPSATKLFKADFSNNTATVAQGEVLGLDAFTTSGEATYFLRTPTDETAETGNNGNDQNGVWFGIPQPNAAPKNGFSNVPALTAQSGWRYEGWVVVNGNPISTGTFYAFSGKKDSGNPYIVEHKTMMDLQYQGKIFS